MNQRFPIADAELRDFCRAHHIRKMALFGSVPREDFGGEIEIALSERLERKVDLNTPGFLSRYFRADILKEAETLYAAR